MADASTCQIGLTTGKCEVYLFDTSMPETAVLECKGRARCCPGRRSPPQPALAVLLPVQQHTILLCYSHGLLKPVHLSNPRLQQRSLHSNTLLSALFNSPRQLTHETLARLT